jgi:hypothetical protein
MWGAVDELKGEFIQQQWNLVEWIKNGPKIIQIDFERGHPGGKRPKANAKYVKEFNKDKCNIF